MATVADISLSSWVKQPSSPFWDASYVFSLRPTVGAFPPIYTPSADSRLIYVDATLGNDGTGAPTDIATQGNAFEPQGAFSAYQTIAAAAAQARDGFPDWILLKRGEEFTEKVVLKNGRSDSERFLVGAYGSSGDRPLFKMSNMYDLAGGSINNVIIYGLECYHTARDPGHADYLIGQVGYKGLRFVGSGNNITVDDCRLRFHEFGLQVQYNNTSSYITNFKLRNSIISDCYETDVANTNSGAIFVYVDGLELTGNVFDHNGWNESIVGAEGTKFNHNCYIQRDCFGSVLVENNVFARAPSHGLHGRPAGVYRNNLFLRNGVSLGIAYSGTPLPNGTTAYAHNNVVMEGDGMPSGTSTSNAIWGIDVAADALDLGGAVDVRNNIVANALEDSVQGYLNVALWLVSGGVYSDNIAWNWRSYRDLLDMTDPGWSDPSVTVAGFAAAYGIGASTPDYLDFVKSRPLGLSYAQYSAQAVNGYIRAGFDLSAYGV